MKIALTAGLLLTIIFLQPATAQPGYVQCDGMLLRDSLGRMLFLRGLNYVNKDAKNKHLNLTKDEAFLKMKQWGYNAVRMGVTWSALEPAPGHYDSTYLNDLDMRIAYAKQHGIYVILDMHQDLYGEKFGGGAPLWATIDEGKPHHTGGTWSDAYFISPAVQTAFDSFWNNTPVADGTGVQDHLIKTWAMLAERYAQQRHVVGFDVLNEPFVGSPVNEALHEMIIEVTDALNQSNNGKGYTPEEVAGMWMDEQGKGFILKALTGTAVFSRVLQRMEPTYRAFEEGRLLPFYRKLATAIRKVNTTHILFWEPSVSSNNGIPSSLSPVEEAGNQQGYMPHFYDIVLDTDQAGEADAGRLTLILGQLHNTMQRLQLPTLIGEWGAFYGGGQGVVRAADIMASKIDSLLIGNFYWDYFAGLENQVYFQDVLFRPCAQAIAGELLAQEVTKNSIHLTWQEDGTIRSNTLIFVPHTHQLKVSGAKYERVSLKGGGAVLEIAPLKKKIVRTVAIEWGDNND